jgi:hypothetical protein
MRAAIDVKHFTRDELCIVQVHHRINDLIDFARLSDLSYSRCGKDSESIHSK